jgi:NADH:ubiquinone oxidoreductase subunit 5 (subunit L)/multisubunit Na+/H+ antiporter MnhA subunit
MTRLWINVFGDSVCSLAHEGHLSMLVPMVILATITVGIGWTQPLFLSMLGEHASWPDPLMAALSFAVFVVGVGGGYLVYAKNMVDRDALRARYFRFYGALKNGFYFDWTYNGFIVQPFFAISAWLSTFDARRVDGAVNGVASSWSKLSDAMSRGDAQVIDGAVNGLGHFVQRSGDRVRKLQVGRVQVYQRLAYAGLFAILVVIAIAAWLANYLPILRGA